MRLLDSEQKFDAEKYLEMLLKAAETLLGEFGYDLDTIKERGRAS